MTMVLTTDRPWDYAIQGRVDAPLLDEELEALADRFTPARISIYYEADTLELSLRGYTTSDEPWEQIGWLHRTTVDVLSDNEFHLVDAQVHEGATDEETVEALRDMGLYEGPAEHGYEGGPR